MLEALASPTAVVALGTTTLILLYTTYRFTKSTESTTSSSSNNNDTCTESSTSATVDTKKYPGGTLTIYYGSQTGTAQMFAEQLVHDALGKGFMAKAVDLQDFIDDIADVDEADGGAGGNTTSLRALVGEEGDGSNNGNKAIFLMATYGEGEPTDNARQFVELIKSKSNIDNLYKLPKTTDDEEQISSDLQGLDYAVFGLGNTQYEHYNNMGKFVDVALARVGGCRIIPIGLGDDNDDLEGDFENWKDNLLWPAMKARYVSSDDDLEQEEKIMDDLPSCTYEVEYLNGKDSAFTVAADRVQTSHKHYINSVDCKVVAKRELRNASDPGSTIHMEIDISNNMNVMKYQTADNLGVLPKNDPVIVQNVAKALGYNLDQLFDLHPANKDKIEKHTLPFPTPCTVRTALERYCNLTGLPRRSDLKQLASYARDDMDRKALLRMAAKEGKAEYKEKIVECHVGIYDIVTKLCPSIMCPLEHFIMVCPPMQPRYYTISSSSTVHPKTIHITFSVTEESKKDGSKFKGCCSGDLERKQPGDLVRVYVRDSTFRLPKQMERPVLMIGPGTGIAPMRAVLQERSHWRKALPNDNHGPNVLYFGCKDRTMDYIYRDELEAFQNEGTLKELHVAFSREQTEKVYVQHLLAKQSAETYKYIHEGKASIFVCGAVLMGAAVDHTLQDILMEQGKMSRVDAKKYLDKLALEGRFVQELWS